MHPILSERWQPFHNGSLWAVEEVIKKYGSATLVIINIDPSNPPNPNYKRFRLNSNPLNMWERYLMIISALSDKKILEHVRIVPGWHPRESIRGENFCLPSSSKRFWIIPHISDEDESKADDFEKHHETVELLKVAAKFKSVNPVEIKELIKRDNPKWKRFLPSPILILDEKLFFSEKIKKGFSSHTLESFTKSNIKTVFLIGEFIPFYKPHIEYILSIEAEFDVITLLPILKVKNNSNFNWPELKYTEESVPLNYWDISELIRTATIPYEHLDKKIIIHPLLVKEKSFHLNLNNFPSKRDWILLTQKYQFIEEFLLNQDEKVSVNYLEPKIEDIEDLTNFDLTKEQRSHLKSISLSSRLSAIKKGIRPGEKKESETQVINIGICTIVTSETNSVKECLNSSHQENGIKTKHREYSIGKLKGKNGTSHNIALLALSEMGQSAASTAYKDLVTEFNPSIIFLIGIGGSINKDVDICDVVLSDGVIHYEKGKETESGLDRTGKEILNSLFVSKTINSFFDTYSEYPFFDAIPDAFTDKYKVHRGLIGTGEKIITRKDSETIAWLKKFNRKTLCVETEAYGFLLAYEESKEHSDQKGVFIIRGISDKPIENIQDKDKYRNQCSSHAVETMLRILELIPGIE